MMEKMTKRLVMEQRDSIRMATMSKLVGFVQLAIGIGKGLA
jgi:hypothetical protein